MQEVRSIWGIKTILLLQELKYYPSRNCEHGCNASEEKFWATSKPSGVDPTNQNYAWDSDKEY
jgi:hypothetical protein